MKTKYERMSRIEKKELYLEYKKEKQTFAKKMERMFMLCYIGILYGVCSFCYDFFYKSSTLGYILDIVVLVFSFIALLKVISIKKNLLNKYVLKKDKQKKQEIVKKYKK